MSLPEGFNLLNPATFDRGHPFDAYEALRQSGRVVRHPGNDDMDPFWLLTLHQDVHAVSHDTERFTSVKGFNLGTASRSMSNSAIVQAIGRNILGYDVPEHTEFRSALMPGLSRRKLETLESLTQSYVAELLDPLPRNEEIDFVQAVAAPIPIRVLCALLGIPEQDEARILGWTNRMVGVQDPDLVANPAESFAAYMEVFEYGKRLVEQRRQEPQQDLMTLVAQAQLDGAPMSDATRDGMCATLIAAGNETTRNALSGAAVLLAANPGQRRWLADNPDQAPNAVAELVRRITPVIHMVRTAKQDLDIAGQPIAAGDRVAMLYGAANHDPELFADPYALQLDRSNARSHLAFGTGIHFCIGARLAQMELRVALNALLQKFPNFELTGEPRYLRSNFVCGIKSLPLRLGD